MADATFAGTVTRGRLVLDAPDQWAIWLAAHEGKRLAVTAETERQRRSNAQNRRYWSLVVPVAAEVLSVNRTIPLSKDQAHEVLKYAFIGHETTPLGPVPKSSRVLSTLEFSEFCNKVEEWLLHTFGVAMPENGEFA